MESFIALNKKKIPFVFTIISSIILGFVGLILLYAWITNDYFPVRKGLAILFLISGIVVPAFIFLLTYLGWYVDRSARIRVLKKAPFESIT